MRIKICGITRPSDAVTAAEIGADAIGLVFAKSPRQVRRQRAREIVAALPPWISTVGVFVNVPSDDIKRVADAVGISDVQLHGDESAKQIKQLAPLRVTRAIAVRDGGFVDDIARFRDAGVAGILLDTFSQQVRGGSGRQFDWSLVEKVRKAGLLDGSPPIILAGGLTPRNVNAGIRAVRPWGVDVSGGVESAPGIKSRDLMKQFVASVRRATHR